LQLASAHDHVGVAHRRHLLDVGAGGEDLRAAVDNDGGHGGVERHFARGIPDRVLHGDVEGVHRRAVEAQRGDPVIDLDGCGGHVSGSMTLGLF